MQIINEGALRGMSSLLRGGAEGMPDQWQENPGRRTKKRETAGSLFEG